ncbi:MAG: FkbM family methyltransferase [Dehalococcoidia bacterium]
MISDKRYVIRYGGRQFNLRYLSDDDIAAKEGGHKGRFQELELLEDIQKLGLTGTYVDAGANVGNHTLFFANFTQAERILAIEANPVIFEVLKRNISSNASGAPIEMKQFAAWCEDAIVRMGDPVPGNAGRSQIHGLGPHGGARYRVSARPLDDALASYPNITLLKMDIEDAELPALEGCLETLEVCKPVLVTEHHFPAQLKQALHLLEPLGYTLQGKTYEPRGETKMWLPS